MVNVDVKGWKNVMRGECGALLEKAVEMEAQGIAFEYQGDGVGNGALWIGQPPGSALPRCGAKTRAGGECQARAVKGGSRCRMHGGLSTGPKTAAGRAKIAESNRRRAERVDQLMREIKEMRG